ncbi:MAG: T9SS type A sorting domain-containing protein [Prolixibacteraceae bacterium]|nr:T9SS type A sorting domain-containing protein [Prolixibacteraceae bacterium]
MKKLFTILFFLLSLNSFSQELKVYSEWNKTIGHNTSQQINSIISTIDRGVIFEYYKYPGGKDYRVYSKVQQTSDKGFLISGYTYWTLSSMMEWRSWGDVFLIKTDSLGNTEWEKTYGRELSDIIYSIFETPSGGFVFGGHSLSPKMNTGYYNRYDFWIVEVDSRGYIIWSKFYGGYEDEQISGFLRTPDGGYILAGNAGYSAGSPEENKDVDIWLVKIDSLGNILWERKYGGSGDESLNSISLSSDGGYNFSCIAINDGEFQADEIPYGYQWVYSIDNNGNVLSKIESIAPISYDNSLKTDDSGFLLGSYIKNTISEFDIKVEKTDSTGKVQWEKIFGGTKSDFLDYLYQDADGGYILAGTTSSSDGDIHSGNKGLDDVWIVKVNSEGIIEWEKTFGSEKSDRFKSITQTTDSGYLILGYSIDDKDSVNKIVIWIEKIRINSLGTDKPMSDKDINLIKTYPNPVNGGILNIEIPENEKFQIKVFDINGSVLYNFTQDERIRSIDLNEITEGVYFLQFTNDVYTKIIKIIKRD